MTGDTLHTLSLEQAKQCIAYERERQAGWKFLLDLRAHQRTLLVAPEGGWIALSLSKHYQNLVVLQAHPIFQEAVRKPAEATPHPAICVCASLAHPFPFSDSVFDCVIFHDMGTLLNRTGVKGDRLFEEGHRVVKQDGTLVVTGENQSWILRILSGWALLKAHMRRQGPRYTDNRYPPRSFGLPSAEALVRPLGFKHREAFALAPRLVSFSSIKPIIEPGSGMLKKVAAVWRRWDSPAYLIVARKGGANHSFLAQFQKTVLEPHGGGSPVHIQRYLTGNPNVVILIVSAGNDRQSHLVVRLPLTEISFARCQKNWNALLILSRAGTPACPIGKEGAEGVLSEKIPRAIGLGEFLGQPYFIESFIPGLALVDPKPAALRQGMREAIPLLIAFHQASAVRHVVDPPLFDKTASPFFEGLLPSIQQEETRKRLHYLYDFLHERLIGHPLSFVYSHGDWQVENMVFDPVTFRIRGVIDWDLSQPDSLPLLDLLYLFLYAETLSGRGGFEAVFCRRFLPFRLHRHEQDALEQYQSAVGVSPDQVLPLLVFLWLHHVVFRLEPIWHQVDTWMQTIFASTLSEICETIRKETG